jgi:chlorobactene glucosyltransferase
MLFDPGDLTTRLPWVPILAALPWIVIPSGIAWRGRERQTLSDWPASVPDKAPALAIIIPARNESENIDACVRSIRDTTYPRVEIIVVDDDSNDATGELAMHAAEGDPRVRVIRAPPPPAGWFGKQWACATGASMTSAGLLLFTDADTVHSPASHARAYNAMRSRGAALISLAGTQEMKSFWERVLQPQVFTILRARYGSSDRVTRARSPRDAIANGQFLMAKREDYAAVGGHASVRALVAEDLGLAQLFVASGRIAALVFAPAELRTRMYRSLGEIQRGWGKNIYAGGLHATPLGMLGRMLLPLALAVPSLFQLAPVLAIVAGLAAGMNALAIWGSIATAALLVSWATAYRFTYGLSPCWCAAFPLGAALLLEIVIRAVLRGRRVEWKGREYSAE